MCMRKKGPRDIQSEEVEERSEGENKEQCSLLVSVQVSKIKQGRSRGVGC